MGPTFQERLVSALLTCPFPSALLDILPAFEERAELNQTKLDVVIIHAGRPDITFRNLCHFIPGNRLIGSGIDYTIFNPVQGPGPYLGTVSSTREWLLRSDEQTPFSNKVRLEKELVAERDLSGRSISDGSLHKRWPLCRMLADATCLVFPWNPSGDHWVAVKTTPPAHPWTNGTIPGV